jgi:N-acetylneuraminic acid mutarotase
VAYNGFLYAIGGSNSGGTPQTTVYIAKLGVNGEPQLWHPSGGTPTYWYSDTALGTARSQFAAVAYNNHLYILGGLSASTTVLSSNTVQYADIRPNGTLTTWTSTGMQALSGTGGGNRYGLTAHIYNDTMYVIGGDATFSGTPVTNVDYSKLNSDGTMNTWVTTDIGNG